MVEWIGVTTRIELWLSIDVEILLINAGRLAKIICRWSQLPMKVTQRS